MLRRGRALAGCLSLGLALACTSQQAPAEDSTDLARESTRRPATPQIGAWVRVDNQRLLSAPDPNARVTVESRHPHRVAEIVAIVDDRFVELRSLTVEPEALCATGSGADANVEVRFFAEVAALQAVLVTPKVIEYEDGTKLEFAPGVPVDTSGSVPILDVGGGGRFAVPLEVEDIGWWYAPASTLAPPWPTSGWTGFAALRHGQLAFEASRADPFIGVHERRSLGDGDMLLTFVDACGRFTLRTEDEPPRDPPSKSDSLYAMKGPKHAIPKMARGLHPDWVPCFRWYAEAGVQLLWPESGTIAGTLRNATWLPAAIPDDDRKVCIPVVDFRLCVPVEQLTMGPMVMCLRDDPPESD